MNYEKREKARNRITNTDYERYKMTRKRGLSFVYETFVFQSWMMAEIDEQAEFNVC